MRRSKVRKIGGSSDRRQSRLPPTPRVTVATALLVRLGALFGFHIHSHQVGEGGFNAFPYGGLDDGRYYYTTAEQLADGIAPPYVLNAFPRVLAVFMEIGIRDLLALKLISFTVSSIAVVLSAALAWHFTRALELEVRKWAVVVATALACLFPSSVFWSMNSLMRDGWILSFVLIAIWSFSGATPTILPRLRWLLGPAALAAAVTFRPYVLVVFLAALVSAQFSFANPMARLKPRFGPVLLRLVVLAGGFIAICIAIEPVVTRVTGFNILGWRSRQELLDKGSSLGYQFDVIDPPLIVLYYLISVVSNAVGPFPWQIVTANQTLVFVEIPFFVIICAGLLKTSYSDKVLRFCGLFGLYWLLLLGLWNDVLGNGTRNRIIAWPILAIAAAPAIAQYIAQRNEQPEKRPDKAGERSPSKVSDKRLSRKARSVAKAKAMAEAAAAVAETAAATEEVQVPAEAAASVESAPVKKKTNRSLRKKKQAAATVIDLNANGTTDTTAVLAPEPHTDLAADPHGDHEAGEVRGAKAELQEAKRRLLPTLRNNRVPYDQDDDESTVTMYRKGFFGDELLEEPTTEPYDMDVERTLTVYHNGFFGEGGPDPTDESRSELSDR